MMVSEFHREIHTRLMQRRNPTTLWGSPFHNAWVGFVLFDHKVRDEKSLNDILSFFERWLSSAPDISILLKEERNIGAISLYCGILSKYESKERINELQALVKSKLIELDKKEKWKFTLFNSPEIFYVTVVGLVMSKSLDKDARSLLLRHLRKEAMNDWFNKVYRFSLYSAAILELKEDKAKINDKIIKFASSIDVNKLDIDEMTSLLWFLTRYSEHIFSVTEDKIIQKLIEDKRRKLWEQFKDQYTYFSYDIQKPSVEIDVEEEPVYSLSTFQIAMVDDALAYREKTYRVNPNDVFDSLYIHPIIRKASEKLFKDGHYTSAIFEAYKALINYVKEKSGKKTLDGQSLMGNVFDVKYDKQTLEVTKKPILQLNELRTREDMDEQKGFMHLFVGSVLGIRNPKAHGVIEQKDPFKTLEYLSLASLLAKRVDEAKRNIET